MSNKLIELFLEPMGEGYKSEQARALVRDILMNNVTSFKSLAERHSEKIENVERYIKFANNQLKTEKYSIESIRTAYIRFLEYEVSLYAD